MRILCVEDNPVNQALLRTLLKRRPGLEVEITSLGQEGIELCTKSKPVMVFCDLHLPDLGGEEVVRAIKSNPDTKDVVVVVVSADATEASYTKVMEAGASAYLTKPFNLKEFYQLLDNYT